MERSMIMPTVYSDVDHRIRSYWPTGICVRHFPFICIKLGFQGANAHGRGCRGGGPPLPPAE